MLRWTHAWALQELEPWREARITPAELDDRLDEAVATHGQMFRYDLAAGRVTLRPQRFAQVGEQPHDPIATEVQMRARAYRDLLQSALPLSGLRRPVSLVVDVSDLPPACPGVPFFAFQRRRGEASLLLPDVDLLLYRYLDLPHWRDRLRHDAKRNAAIFVGSTSGELLTQEKVAALSPPRLRAAAYFRCSPDVTFELPNVVQCDTPETEAAVKALGLGDRFVSWSEQLRYRHLISIDGNGATCSRVAIALHSHSTLLKYDSPYELFYFKGLQADVHYVPISSDADVEAVIEDAAKRPAHYARIAREGRRFFRRHLGRGPCRRYVAALLAAYAEVFSED